MPDLASTLDRPARMVFTNRVGGASSSPYDSFNLGGHVGDDSSLVRENRRRLASSVGLDPARIVWMEQLHTNTVTVVDEPSSEPVPATDALVTTTRGLALAVLVADCVPVLLSDHTHGVVAAAHAGRIGARNGIVRLTVEKMLDKGARPGTIQVLLGPAASGQRYEVPDEMAADVEKHLPGSRTRTLDGTAGIDVRAGLVRQLRDLGVSNIHVDPRCTIADDTFFSYRRDGVTGRQAGLVWLP
ncbi:peptidoglycan editing factor PgeF [Corynebacterium doosanense]|uniref:Purine nucleoside phosphorylase n=1 Tax=Corynebacterium doosanense CAU 212 = DSM 45436 TaxID=558173 RepID=A0A097IH76_9CORY|nr:peptidoglycan editing factor PgeF [Corynebacterium doosanense]AIT61457.1 laccase [Corynebacterium doosanense CAU 212 = DSM 45436]